MLWLYAAALIYLMLIFMIIYQFMRMSAVRVVTVKHLRDFDIILFATYDNNKYNTVVPTYRRGFALK